MSGRVIPLTINLTLLVHVHVREADETARPAHDVAPGPTAPVSTAAATQEGDHVDGSASAHPNVAMRGEVEASSAAAEPHADEASPAQTITNNSPDGASGRSVSDLPRTARDGLTGGDGRERPATLSPDGASEMVGGFPVPAAPSSRGGTGGPDQAENMIDADVSEGVTAGETATSSEWFALGVPSPADYRPHCRNRDVCAGVGLKHCYSCQKIGDAALAEAA